MLTRETEIEWEIERQTPGRDNRDRDRQDRDKGDRDTDRTGTREIQ